MNKLIKNELIKIFFKKSTYVIYLILFIYVLLTNIIYKTSIDENGNFISDSYNSTYLSTAKEELSKLDLTNEKNKSYELSLKKDIMKYELYEKYGYNSWQSYFIDEMDLLISNIIDSKYNNNPLLDTYIQEYNLYIEKFNNNDWKYFVNEEISLLKEDINNNKVKLMLLNYRLENNIDYSKSYINTAINEYYINYNNLKAIENDIKYKNNNKLLNQYYNILSSLYTNKYILDNKIDINKINDTRGILINLFNEYELIIVIIIIIISSVIISKEFTKGTINHLLTSPYTKEQILLSKYITCIIMILLTLLFTIITQLIIGSIMFTTSSLKIPVVIYNISTKSIITYNIFHYLLIIIISKLPMFLIIVTIIFFIETIFLNNILSIIIGIILYLSTILLNIPNIKYVDLFITSNWDFSNYLFGMIPSINNITFNKSVIIYIIYFIILSISSIIIFKNKDIKSV